MAQAALLDSDDVAWTEALTRVRHDVYHLPQYVRLDAKQAGGVPAAFRYDDGGRVLLLPFVLRTVLDSDLRDAVSPYGYPGPVSDAGPADTGFWNRACRAMVDLLCTQGIVTSFVRLHPLLPAPTAVLAEVGTVVHHGETVSLDLSLSLEQMWRQTGKTRRNQINKARRANVQIVVDDWDRLDDWIDTSHANMRRVGAAEFYFFAPDHFHGLRAALDDQAHLALAVINGELLGGNLFFEYGGIIHTHLQSTRDGRVHHADKLLYDEIRRWGQDRGNVVYHLGGGVGGSADSLFAYKAAFGTGRHDYHTWRVVADPDNFEKLTGQPPPDSLTGHFPPYR